MALEAINLLEDYVNNCAQEKTTPILAFTRTMEKYISDGETPVEIKLNGSRIRKLKTQDKLESNQFRMLILPMQKATFLKSLDLSNNFLTDQSALLIADYLGIAKNLEKLNISMNEISVVGAQAISGALTTNTTLKSFNISRNPIGNDGGMYFASMLQVNSTLVEFDISSCDLHTEAVLSFIIDLKNHPSIVSFKIDDPLRRFRKDDLIIHIPRMLHTNHILRHLSLSKHSIGDNEAEQLAKGLGVNCGLETLDLSCNNIMADGCTAIAEAIKYNPLLLSLNLAHNQILNEGARALSRLLKWDTSLQKLDISYNNINPEGLTALYSNIKPNRSLQCLNAWGNNWNSSACELFQNLIDIKRLKPENIDIVIYKVEEEYQAVVNSYIGFDSITSQIERKMLKRGFELNLMLVGATGLGKTTFVNTLFSTHILDSKYPRQPDEPLRKTTEIETHPFVLEENNVTLKLTVIDTPGFGDNVNNDGCWEPLVNHIVDQYRTFLMNESAVTRPKKLEDNRVHLVLYFIAPTGHSLKPIDIIVMEKLSKICNLVPVIAKSDTLTVEERDMFKKRIRNELVFNNIELYPFDNLEEDTPEDVVLNQKIRVTNYHLRYLQSYVPFAIVGSERNVLAEGKAVRGRRTRWGVVDVENETHCEFIPLRNFIIRTHLQDLIESTAMVHYEKFRKARLEQQTQK